MARCWFAGFIGVALVVFSVAMPDSLSIDDPWVPSPFKAPGGMWGTLACWPVPNKGTKGLLYGHGFGQFGYQIVEFMAYGIFAVSPS